MAADTDTYTCAFPGCDQTAETTVMREGAEGVPLCAAHMNLIVDNPDEFERIWGSPDQPPRGLAAPIDEPD